MSYKPPRSLRVTAAVVAAVIVICVSAYAHWYAVKERYFHAVLSSCRSWHGVGRLQWHRSLAFDGDVRRFEAIGERETAMTRCVNRWAGAIISNHVAAKTARWREVSGVLEISISGQNHAPPERIFNVAYTQFVPAEETD